MKKSMLILILTALLTACTTTENVPNSAEIPTVQTAAETSETEENSEIESCSESEPQPLTECKISTTETTVMTAKIQSETVCSMTAVTEMQKEKSQEDPTEIRQEEVVKTAEDLAEKPTEYTEEITENTVEKTAAPPQTEMAQTAENTEVTAAEPEEYAEETSAAECGLSDYEKAAEIYNFMTANGSGTCVQYAYQTYEICRQYGLECYFAWTENQLYGHVANVVNVDGIWYILDTQAGCFLTENMCGFTEIVDENENHIANADIISGVRYE